MPFFYRFFHGIYSRYSNNLTLRVCERENNRGRERKRKTQEEIVREKGRDWDIKDKDKGSGL